MFSVMETSSKLVLERFGRVVLLSGSASGFYKGVWPSSRDRTPSTKALSAMHPRKCLPSRLQISMTEGLPDFRPRASLKAKGCWHTGQGAFCGEVFIMGFPPSPSSRRKVDIERCL